MSTSQKVDTTAKTVGLIGCGNMGGALARGFASKAFQVKVYDTNPQKVLELSQHDGIEAMDSAAAVASNCSNLVLAVKPNGISEQVKKLAESFSNSSHIISVAAGVTTAQIESACGNSNVLVTRVMPNLPALIGKGISAIYSKSDRARQVSEDLFNSVGETIQVTKEAEINAFTGVAGSGPAYICLIVEALADGAVQSGLSRENAMKAAIHTVLGTSEYLLTSELHPAVLKDMVSSPGGTTICGLNTLENGGLRATLINAVKSATERAEELAAQQ